MGLEEYGKLTAVYFIGGRGITGPPNTDPPNIDPPNIGPTEAGTEGLNGKELAPCSIPPIPKPKPEPGGTGLGYSPKS